jgi:hypothetical protein
MDGYSYISNPKKAADVGEKPAPGKKNMIHQLEQTTTYPYLDTDKDIAYSVMIEYISALKTDVAIVMEAFLSTDYTNYTQINTNFIGMSRSYG